MSLELSPAHGAIPSWAVPSAAPVGPATTAREIPFDHVARFELKGRRGERSRDVLNISTDGAFIAVSIGYSFVPGRLPAPPDPPVRPDPPIDEEPELPPAVPTPVIERVSVPGVRAEGAGDGDEGAATPISAAATTRAAPARHPWVREFFAFLQLPEQQIVESLAPLADWVIDVVRPADLLQRLLLRAYGLDFRYTVVDSGTGRELQNLPIHNLAGLGRADGQRPFRPLPKPMHFAPRSTIRIEVEEISEGPLFAGGELFIVFHGYKVLG